MLHPFAPCDAIRAREHKGAQRMRRSEYERRRQRLDEQLHEGTELLQAAHRHQVRALDLVWSMSEQDEEEEPDPPAVAPSAPPPGPSRRGPHELRDEVEAALAHVPELFDRNDVLRALGHEPHRNALYRVLQEIVTDGLAAIDTPGNGQLPTRYRKTAATDTTA